MKGGTLPLIGLFLTLFIASCDLRSGTAKEEMEKFNGPSQTPTAQPVPTDEPVDPADIVQVDTDQQGDRITVNGYETRQSVTCAKFNPVAVNGERNEVMIKGPCRQIMINGDNNKVKMDAASEIILNGEHSNVEYSGYINGKRPIVTDNGDDNTVEKVSFARVVKDQPGNRPAK